EAAICTDARTVRAGHCTTRSVSSGSEGRERNSSDADAIQGTSRSHFADHVMQSEEPRLEPERHIGWASALCPALPVLLPNPSDQSWLLRQARPARFGRTGTRLLVR